MHSHKGLRFRLKEKRKSSSPRKRRARKTSGGDQSNERSNAPEGAAANADVPPGGDAQTSPDSCPICLCRLDNKSFTDSCFHTFCFVCLQEWSKVKPVCPLCKQKFKSIIHNVRSLDDYDQYYIQQNPPSNNSANIEFDRRFRYRTTLTNDHTYDPWLVRQQHEHDRQLALLQRPSRTTARGHWRRLRQTATSAFRKRIYAQNMRVQSLRTGSGRAPRYRDVTPEFFRRNAACTHRLVPWLNRELNVVLRGDERTNFVSELITDLVKRFEIQSAEFREHIYPFIGKKTDQFIHEFYNFARSPYDMVAYDKNAVYDEPTVTVETDSDRTSAVEQDDILVMSPPEPLRRQPSASLGAPSTASQSTDPLSLTTMNYRGQSRSDSFSIRLQELLADAFSGDTANSGWESPIPGPSSSVMWSPPIPTTPPRLSSGNAEPFGFYSTMSISTAVASTSENTVTVVETSSSSDSESDIEIIGYEKPFEQRTPIAILSDSEPDIIDLDDQTSHKSKKKSKKKKKKKSKDRSPEHRRRRDRSRSRSRTRERRRREYSTDACSDGSRSSPKRDRRDIDRHREKERRTEYLRSHKQSYHSSHHKDKDPSERSDERRSRRRRLSSGSRHSDKDRHDSDRRDRSRSRSRDRSRSRSRSHERTKSEGRRNNRSETRVTSVRSRSRSRSSSPSFSIDSEILRRHKKGTKSEKSKRKSRSPSFDLDLNFDISRLESLDQRKSKKSKRKSRSPSSEPDLDINIRRPDRNSGLRPILKRRTSDKHQETNEVGEEQEEIGQTSGIESQGHFWSPKVKFWKLQPTSKSPSPNHEALHSPSVERMAEESEFYEGVKVWDRLGPEHNKLRQETREQRGSQPTKSRSRSRSWEGKEDISRGRENSRREEPKQSPRSTYKDRLGRSIPDECRVARKRVPEGFRWGSESESEQDSTKHRENRNCTESEQSPRSTDKDAPKLMPNESRVARKRVPEGYRWGSGSESEQDTTRDRENRNYTKSEQSPRSTDKDALRLMPSESRVARKKVPEGYRWSSESESEYRKVASRVERKKKSTDHRSASESESSDCKMYSDSNSPQKSRNQNISSVVRRKSRSRSKSSDSSSSHARSVASVIRVKSRSRSRSSDCQFFISRSKYRGHDSDIEFIVAKPAKRHKRYKHHKKHKKRRYYVIEDSDSDGNQEIEILDVIPTKHKKKSKESNTEGKKYKKHHTGHKKSSKKKSSSGGGETSQENNNANSRRAERAASTDSVELVGVDNRNVPTFIGAEIDILIPELILPQDEPTNLTHRRPGSPQVLSGSPDELHRKCEVSSSSADLPDLESIMGEKACKFDPLSIAGEVVAYPLHGQERGRGDGREESSDSDRDDGKKKPLPPVKVTIASITDTVERELAKKRDRDRESATATAAQGAAPAGENGRQEEELHRATNPAYEDGESLSHLNRPPCAMEWLSSSTSNGTTVCASSTSETSQTTERKRPSADPIMSSVAFKSPRVSDNETMDTQSTGPVTMATSSGDESLPGRHHPMETSLGIDIHVTQSDVAMETEELPTIGKEDSQVETTKEKGGDSEVNGEHGECLPKETTEGFGLLPPSCDPRNRSPSKDPVLFSISMPSDAVEGKITTTTDKSDPSSTTETTAQTISTIVQAVEKELSSRRSSQSEDSNNECVSTEDTMEQKSREIVSVSGDRSKTPPPLAMDNMFSLGSNTDSDEDNNDNRSSQSPVDPNLYELVGQMRRSPSRSASMILLASMNAQKIFNAPGTSTDEPSSGSPEKDFVHHSDEEKLQFEEALPSTQESLADMSDIVGGLSKPSTSTRLEVEKQRIDRIMSLTRMDLFEPESTSSEAVHESSDGAVNTGVATDLGSSQSTTSPSVAPSSVTDLLQKDIQTNNGSSSDDLTSLEKQMREKIAARLEQKDLLPPNEDD